MMTTININETENSPKLILDYQNGLIEIAGKSYPENTMEFYQPILKWLKEYFSKDTINQTIINIKLSYFNSATTQVLFDLFDIVEDGKHSNLDINWYYDASNANSVEDYEDYSEEFPNLNIQAKEF